MKAEFEQQVLDHHSEEALSKNTPLFALYNAMLTIGSQLNGHGSFEPGEGASWQFFQLSLSRLGELIASRPGVLSVQVREIPFIYITPKVTDTLRGITRNGERPFVLPCGR